MLINLEPRFAPAYRIKIGGFNPDVVKRARESNREYRPPVKWDHFKVCHNDRDPVTGNFRPALEIMEHYRKGDEDPADAKPTSLNILLFSNTLADIFDDWRALYMSRRCLCRTVDEFVTPDDQLFGDPEEALQHLDEMTDAGPIVQLAAWDKTQYKVPRSFKVANETETTAFLHCPERHCPYTEKKQCKVNSIFRCMILEAPELGAVAEFRTTSVHSAMQLKKSLEMVHSLTGGHMAGVELALRLEPKSVEQGTVFVAHVVYPHGGLLDLKKAATEFRTAELSFDRQLLIAEASVAHFDESVEEAAAVEAEFYEEGQNGDVVVEDPTDSDGKEPTTEDPKVEETPEESADPATDELPFEPPDEVETSDELPVEQPVRHDDCPFPESAKVDPSYCEAECKLKRDCGAYLEFEKGGVPWETSDEVPESPAADKTFDLFK